ncbi:uncharacterized protein LOC112898469 isoform X2 [Panicum hallii]|uniref:uncharacterized protein LOC112898469 isoform X2 n=1 Tax=Panicum hallii TaxID=206008 RepID=UPI000DF4DD40|nr:uncharacterized protein LOC112898469 isoform X2 [Panicum hallii]
MLGGPSIFSSLLPPALPCPARLPSFQAPLTAATAAGTRRIPGSGRVGAASGRRSDSGRAGSVVAAGFHTVAGESTACASSSPVVSTASSPAISPRASLPPSSLFERPRQQARGIRGGGCAGAAAASEQRLPSPPTLLPSSSTREQWRVGGSNSGRLGPAAAGTQRAVGVTATQSRRCDAQAEAGTFSGPGRRGPGGGGGQGGGCCLNKIWKSTRR